MSKNKLGRVAIIGGGPAGLRLARILEGVGVSGRGGCLFSTLTLTHPPTPTPLKMIIMVKIVSLERVHRITSCV
jgi:hypothetical protein